MADDKALSRELTSLLEALPRAQLVEISRWAAIGGFNSACRKQLGERSLENVLSSLFPDFSADQVATAARKMGLCAIRNTSWSQLLSLPGEHKVEIRSVNPKRADALRNRTGPAILAFWHIGASFMMSLGLQRIRVPALIFSRKSPPLWFHKAVSPEMKMAVTNNDPSRTTLALKMAFERLRKGGAVALSVDGSQGKKDLAVKFLGRKVVLSRGLAVLARLTGAPIIPCAVTWGAKDWSLDFRLFDPLALPPPPAGPLEAPAWDQSVLNETARRFEEIFRAFPGQCRLEKLSLIAKAPPFL